MTQPCISLPLEKKGGKVQIDRPRFARLLEMLADGRYEVLVERWSETRSQQQNRYYHGVVVELLADYWGLDHDDAHELIKLHCNPKIITVLNKESGELQEETIGASTAKLSKENWSKFIERCQRWAAEEFNVVIPDPNQEYAFDR